MKKIILMAALACVSTSIGLAQTQPVSNPGSFEYKSASMPGVESIASRPATAHPIYGINGRYAEVIDPAFIKAYKSAGFSALRLTGPLIQGDQTTGIRYGDRVFAEIAAMGMEVMYNAAIEGDAWGPLQYASEEAFLDAFMDHLTFILNRYGPGGAFWVEHPALPQNPLRTIELWNEPNMHTLYPSGTDAARQSLYARMLVRGYRHIKARWPTVQVIGFSTSGDFAADAGFINAVLRNAATPEAQNSFDILSTHPYMGSSPPEAYRNDGPVPYSAAEGLAAIRTFPGVNAKPFWYTETGWETAGDDAVPPLFQAAYVCRMFAWALRLGVDRVHLMFTQDTAGYSGGIFNSDGSFRAAAYAIQNMIRLMPHPKLIGAISDNVDGYSAYRFRSNAANPESYEVIMVWNGKRPKRVNFQLAPGKYKIVSMLGLITAVDTESGSISLETGPYPVYVVPAGLVDPAVRVAPPARLRIRP